MHALQGAPPSPPSIRVLGAAWDSSLGGVAFTNRLVDILVKGCLPQADPTSDRRAMARLRKVPPPSNTHSSTCIKTHATRAATLLYSRRRLRVQEATRAKHVLSANKETVVTMVSQARAQRTWPTARRVATPSNTCSNTCMCVATPSNTCSNTCSAL